MRKEDVFPFPTKVSSAVLWTCFFLFRYLLLGPKHRALPTPGKIATPTPILVILIFCSSYKTSSVLPFKLSSINSPKGRMEFPMEEKSKDICLKQKVHSQRGPNMSNISWDYNNVVPSGSCQRPVVGRWPQFSLLSVRPSSQAPCLIQKPPLLFKFTLLYPWGLGSEANGVHSCLSLSIVFIK